MNNDIIFGSEIDVTDAVVIRDLLRLDSLVYPKELQGSYESVLDRLNANKDCLILLVSKDSDTLFDGYFCFFPISEELLMSVIDAGIFLDDNISSKSIIPYSDNTILFFLSAVIDPKKRNVLSFLKMLRKFEEFIEDKKIAGTPVSKIVTYPVNQGIKDLLPKYGFVQAGHLNLEYPLMIKSLV
jgi:hypothetical protein